MRIIIAFLVAILPSLVFSDVCQPSFQDGKEVIKLERSKDGTFIMISAPSKINEREFLSMVIYFYDPDGNSHEHAAWVNIQTESTSDEVFGRFYMVPKNWLRVEIKVNYGEGCPHQYGTSIDI